MKECLFKHESSKSLQLPTHSSKNSWEEEEEKEGGGGGGGGGSISQHLRTFVIYDTRTSCITKKTGNISPTKTWRLSWLMQHSTVRNTHSHKYNSPSWVMFLEEEYYYEITNLMRQMFQRREICVKGLKKVK